MELDQTLQPEYHLQKFFGIISGKSD